MRKLLFLISIITITLLSINLIIAQPPFQVGDPDDGWEIKFPLNQLLKVNERYAFHFHIFNMTDGVPVIPNTFSFGNVSCYFHLYNQTGSHIYTATSTTFTDDFDIEFAVDGNNFSTSGTYSYIAQCNNSAYGGFDSVALDISITGIEFDTWQPLFIIFILGTLLFVAFVMFKSVIEIPMITPVKIFLLAMSVLIAVLVIGINLVIMQDLLTLLENLNNIYSSITIVSIVLLSGAGIGLILWLIVYILTKWNEMRGRRIVDGI